MSHTQRSAAAKTWTLSFCLLLLAVFSAASPAQAQRARLAADPQSSLAWWQLNPHLMHLWGTTCPNEPTWRAGEGVSMSQAGAALKALRRRSGYAIVVDTIHVPLYPRRQARALCTPAVVASVTVDDMSTLRGAKGEVSVAAHTLYTGLKMRDQFLQDLIGTNQFPDIRFTIDSLTAITKKTAPKGDTTYANAVGKFTFHGVTQPMTAPVRMFTENGKMRVIGKFTIPARDIVDVYGLSRQKLLLGINNNIWQYLHMGIDLVMSEVPLLTPADP
jgi:hypothetical protein